MFAKKIKLLIEIRVDPAVLILHALISAKHPGAVLITQLIDYIETGFTVRMSSEMRVLYLLNDALDRGNACDDECRCRRDPHGDDKYLDDLDDIDLSYP